MLRQFTKEQITMKCCKCSKEVDVNENVIPPKWYGMYTTGALVKVVCAECIKKDRDWGK